ncbi:hypothetical protein NHX12_031862 [Muraenolepis orangiensis]|uniref:Uncharacterized protein n=1 Tax=Muraenolepis orangiensis TaxID=630683 RepID=A0A9Q0E8A0_9TELE|nr:hypothetical protein NHX12_031862 [Muraenolepis orangiensis]
MVLRRSVFAEGLLHSQAALTNQPHRMGRLLALWCLLCVCTAQKWKRKAGAPEEPLRQQTCSNLTQVLDNWKFAIVTQVKDLLVNDHSAVLPEYSRIRPLSEALADLYKQFNGLKNDLVGLSAKFDQVETFVEDIQSRRSGPPPPSRYPGPAALPRHGTRDQRPCLATVPGTSGPASATVPGTSGLSPGRCEASDGRQEMGEESLATVLEPSIHCSPFSHRQGAVCLLYILYIHDGKLSS